jgi:hypothetical protein
VRDGKMDAIGNPWKSGSGLKWSEYRRWKKNIMYSRVIQIREQNIIFLAKLP